MSIHRSLRLTLIYFLMFNNSFCVRSFLHPFCVLIRKVVVSLRIPVICMYISLQAVVITSPFTFRFDVTLW